MRNGMKRLHHIIFVVGLMSVLLSACSPSSPYNEGCDLYSNITPFPILNNDSDPTTTEPDPDLEPYKRHGHRLPRRPVKMSVIYGIGVSIPGIDKEDIVSYSIYNEDGALIAEFANDVEFASALFALRGIYELRITLDDYYFSGWICLD